MMRRILVSGAGGFIGGHLVHRLKSEGYWVRGVDLKRPEFRASVADEFVIGDLLDQHVARAVVGSIDEVFQLAACIYPKDNQLDPANPNCAEDSAYPAAPGSEYGWEKLFSERLYLAYLRNFGMEVRISRFHNIFGPEGTWDGGREKAPAALCRKVAQTVDGGKIEILGDGLQARSLLYIDEWLAFSSFFEPAHLLAFPALFALAGLTGNGGPLHAEFPGFGFVGRRKQPGVGGCHRRSAAELLDMPLNGGRQQRGIAGALIIHFVMSDDLILGFPNLDQFAELGRLSRFSLADDFCLWLEDADDLTFGSRVTTHVSLTSLPQHLLYARNHLIQLSLGLFHDRAGTALDFSSDLGRELPGLPHHPARCLHQLDIGTLEFLLALFALVPAGASNVEYPALDATRSVAQFGANLARHRGDLLHHTRQHSHAVVEQCTVGRVVDIGFHNRGVSTQFAALYNLLLLCDRHDTLMEFGDRFRS